ncbi:MAG: enoyl-CoA hydratase/isomerase family protein [Mesorhizobium sp.]
MSVDLKIIEGVAYLTFDRLESVNAISEAMFGQLADRLAELAANPNVRATVLRGAGANFSSGADIKEPIPSVERQLAEPVERHPTALIYRMPRPTLAAIRGYCLGGALELALAADIRIAAEDAVFGFAEIHWALTTGWGGATLLQELIGKGPALQLLLLGEKFGAAEALRLGLVNEVVPAQAFEERTAAIANALATRPDVPVREFRRLLSNPRFEELLQREREMFAEVSQSPQALELLATFGRAASTTDTGTSP